ncbi:hypothetical protein AAHA92_19516 [Salvia divinorum]|uniref:Uncharacterized protein n=1 Tax=Salvia divinorum TaxID=28513 RepID=A0ABD1H8Y4_SALDI
MSISDTCVGRTEPIGVSLTPVISSIDHALPMSTLISQLEHLTSAVTDLRSRMDANDRRVCDTFPAVRPPQAAFWTTADSTNSVCTTTFPHYPVPDTNVAPLVRPTLRADTTDGSPSLFAPAHISEPSPILHGPVCKPR